MQQRTITLNNGVEIPIVGLGVFESSPEDTVTAVDAALKAGYRLIDTAAVYGNEAEVGQALAASDVPREEVFVTTKIWMPDYKETRKAFETSLEKLGLDYVDLYLLHWPVPSAFDVTIAAYKELEALQKEGKIRAIGVSNFSPEHLSELIENTEIVPALNQIEVHPYLTQKPALEAGKQHGILTQAWSPIGGMFKSHPSDPDNITNVIDDPVIVAIAEKHGKSTAQVVLRWHLQNDVAVIPKSVTPSRIESNVDLFDFELSAEEMQRIGALNKDLRGGPHPDDLGLNP